MSPERVDLSPHKSRDAEPPVSFGATVTGGDLMFVRRVISPVDVVDKKSQMSLAKGLPDYCRDAILRPHRTV